MNPIILIHHVPTFGSDARAVGSVMRVILMARAVWWDTFVGTQARAFKLVHESGDGLHCRGPRCIIPANSDTKEAIRIVFLVVPHAWLV